ncbi:MAG: helix-turn-helix domain-containing protein [Cytophagales bacterium]|nr:helix-turn-helix domain-containing protein [Cytophagales bacterium]
MAKKVGTSAPIIGRYERNEIKPSIEVAKKLADELGVTIDYLIGGSNKIFDKDLLKKIEDIESLSEEDRQQIYYVLNMALSYHKTKQAFAK